MRRAAQCYHHPDQGARPSGPPGQYNATTASTARVRTYGARPLGSMGQLWSKSAATLDPPCSGPFHLTLSGPVRSSVEVPGPSLPGAYMPDPSPSHSHKRAVPISAPTRLNWVVGHEWGEDLHGQPKRAEGLHPQKNVSFMQADIASVLAGTRGSVRRSVAAAGRHNTGEMGKCNPEHEGGSARPGPVIFLFLECSARGLLAPPRFAVDHLLLFAVQQ